MDALRGITVIDLCRSYPPAFASAIMADFGAQVVRIDIPGFSFPVDMGSDPNLLSAYSFLDRNKRALSLDLKSKEGKEVFYRLAERADVIIENSKPGTMDAIGIGYKAINERNKRIIYCSVSGYGQDGPYCRLPGHDSNYLSIAGALGLLGEKGRQPIIPSNIIGDMAGAGMHSLSAILIALLARERTGEGQFIDISYTDAVFSLLTFQTQLYLLTGIPPRRGQHLATGSEPFLANYQTKEGNYLNVACIEPWLWENLCRALGCEHFIPNQWTQDLEKKEEIFLFLKKTFLTKTRDEWWEWAKDKDIALTPVLNLEEALDDQQIRYRRMVFELGHPVLGRVKQIGSPFKLSQTPARHTRFSPAYGEHTDEILQELGYDGQEIEALRKNRAI